MWDLVLSALQRRQSLSSSYCVDWESETQMWFTQSHQSLMHSWDSWFKQSYSTIHALDWLNLGDKWHIIFGQLDDVCAAHLGLQSPLIVFSLWDMHCSECSISLTSNLSHKLVRLESFFQLQGQVYWDSEKLSKWPKGASWGWKNHQSTSNLFSFLTRLPYWLK